MSAIHRCSVVQRFQLVNAVRPSRRLGAIGSVVGLLALVVSSLTYLIAATLGIAAIAAQVFWVLIGVVILFVIVNSLLS